MFYLQLKLYANLPTHKHTHTHIHRLKHRHIHTHTHTHTHANQLKIGKMSETEITEISIMEEVVI